MRLRVLCRSYASHAESMRMPANIRRSCCTTICCQSDVHTEGCMWCSGQASLYASRTPPRILAIIIQASQWRKPASMLDSATTSCFSECVQAMEMDARGLQPYCAIFKADSASWSLHVRQHYCCGALPYFGVRHTDHVSSPRCRIRANDLLMSHHEHDVDHRPQRIGVRDRRRRYGRSEQDDAAL